MNKEFASGYVEGFAHALKTERDKIKSELLAIADKGEIDYEIPPAYQVLNVFTHSPLHPSFFILGKKHNKNEYAIFHFDGISEIPVMIETFYEIINSLSEIKT